MRKAVASAELDRLYCFHALRHTYASSLVRRGAKLHTIADQLGHANTIHVMKTYGHLAPKTRADEVRKLSPSIDADNAARARARIELARSTHWLHRPGRALAKAARRWCGARSGHQRLPPCDAAFDGLSIAEDAAAAG